MPSSNSQPPKVPLSERLAKLALTLAEATRREEEADEPPAPPPAPAPPPPAATPASGLQGRLDRHLDALTKIDDARGGRRRAQATLRAVLETFPGAEDAVTDLLSRRYGNNPAKRIAARTAQRSLLDGLRGSERDSEDAVRDAAALAAVVGALREVSTRLDRLDSRLLSLDARVDALARELRQRPR